MPLANRRGDGRPNYLACALRELCRWPAATTVVLLYDLELDADYLLLHGCWPGRRHGPAGGHRPGADQWPDRVGPAWWLARPFRRRAAERVRSRHSEAAIRLACACTSSPCSAAEPESRSAGPGGPLVASSRTAAVGPTPDRAGRAASWWLGTAASHCYVDPYRLTASLLTGHAPAAGGRTARGGVHVTITQLTLRDHAARRSGFPAGSGDPAGHHG